MSKIDIDKFVASLLKAPEGWNEWAIDSEDIKKALADQHLEYKDGEIVSTVYVSGNYSLSISNTKLGTITGGGTYTIPIEPQSNEMQGEQKPFDYEHATITQKDFAPEQEPKFKVGDWIIFNGFIIHIDKVVDGYYITTTFGGMPNSYDWDIDNVARLWSIQDAKDGDVLALISGQSIFLFDGYDKEYCHYSKLTNSFSPNLNYIGFIQHQFVPATKEQCDLLFTKMEEAGYEFDFEKKELKKIEDEIEIPFGAKDSELQEETYYIPKGFHAEIEDDKVVIKKGEKPAEWSDEDEHRVEDTIYFLDTAKKHYASTIELDACIDWLKSLKDRIGG